MKLIIFTSFIICTLTVRFGVSQYNSNNNGYNITDLESDIKLMKNSLFKYKEKERKQLKIITKIENNNIFKFFRDRIEGYLEKSNESKRKKNDSSTDLCLTAFTRSWTGDVRREMKEMKTCADKAINLTFHIPLEDINYIQSVMGGNYSLNIEAVSKDCEHWTVGRSNGITMEDCYAIKSPLFQMMSTSFLNLINNLKQLVTNCTLTTFKEIQNCASVTRNQLENHWSHIHLELDDCLL